MRTVITGSAEVTLPPPTEKKEQYTPKDLSEYGFMCYLCGLSFMEGIISTKYVEREQMESMMRAYERRIAEVTQKYAQLDYGIVTGGTTVPPTGRWDRNVNQAYGVGLAGLQNQMDTHTAQRLRELNDMLKKQMHEPSLWQSVKNVLTFK